MSMLLLKTCLLLDPIDCRSWTDVTKWYNARREAWGLEHAPFLSFHDDHCLDITSQCSKYTWGNPIMPLDFHPDKDLPNLDGKVVFPGGGGSARRFERCGS